MGTFAVDIANTSLNARLCFKMWASSWISIFWSTSSFFFSSLKVMQTSRSELLNPNPFADEPNNWSTASLCFRSFVMKDCNFSTTFSLCFISASDGSISSLSLMRTLEIIRICSSLTAGNGNSSGNFSSSHWSLVCPSFWQDEQKIGTESPSVNFSSKNSNLKWSWLSIFIILNTSVLVIVSNGSERWSGDVTLTELLSSASSESADESFKEIRSKANSKSELSFLSSDSLAVFSLEFVRLEFVVFLSLIIILSMVRV